jgi:hypothetical protein
MSSKSAIMSKILHEPTADRSCGEVPVLETGGPARGLTFRRGDPPYMQIEFFLFTAFLNGVSDLDLGLVCD